MKNHLHLLRKATNSGFTLIELIIASCLTIIVVGGAGYGLFVMTRENVAGNAASDTQYNLNRAADFISDEIKSSSIIAADSTSLPASILTTLGCTGAGNDVGTGTATPVLGLAVNGSTTVNVVYYMQTPSSTWLGSNAIYRCGPGIDSAGAYTASTSSRLLVDLIASTRDSSDPGTCNNGATPFPSNNVGFFVCKSGMLAELHLAASALNTQTGKNVLQWANPNSTSRFANKANYGIITQAYARAPNGAELTVSPASVTRGGGTPLTFTFRRFGNTGSVITVNFTVGGSATLGTHYGTTTSPITTTTGATFSFGSSAGTITFGANDSIETLVIAPIPTVDYSSPRTIIITATSVTGGTLGGATSATGTITN